MLGGNISLLRRRTIVLAQVRGGERTDDKPRNGQSVGATRSDAEDRTQRRAKTLRFEGCAERCRFERGEARFACRDRRLRVGQMTVQFSRMQYQGTLPGEYEWTLKN